MNKEQLTAKAIELSEQLGTAVAVEGMTNSELESLIVSLQTAVDAKESTTVADVDVSSESEGKAEAAAFKAESEPEPMPDFYIAEGKSITTRRGIKVYPDEIFKTDFDLKGRPKEESKAIFDSWVERGVIKKG